MYRVELIDGRIEWMNAESVAHYAGIIKAFVLEDPSDAGFEGEAERLFAEIESSATSRAGARAS